MGDDNFSANRIGFLRALKNVRIDHSFNLNLMAKAITDWKKELNEETKRGKVPLYALHQDQSKIDHFMGRLCSSNLAINTLISEFIKQKVPGEKGVFVR